MVAIFTYGFPVAEENFRKAECTLFTLTHYNELIDIALEMEYIKADQVSLLKQWRKAPDQWMQES
jgi:orotate phosphoribosyltransferase